MKTYIFLLSVFILINSCENRASQIRFEEQSSNMDKEEANTKILHFFVDSINIGNKGKNKIELSKYHTNSETSIEIEFYSLQEGAWLKRNSFDFKTNDINDLLGLSVSLSDFNNDGFYDAIFSSQLAARGGNDIRQLLIYDPHGNSLVSIKNSESFPNMWYNNELNCINSYILSGSTTTVFARLMSDSLREFAKVERSGLERIVSEKDKNGNWIIIQQDSLPNFDDYFEAYQNYKPLKVLY